METLYRGSVKDVVGPASWKGKSALVFQYTDAYSVFDWGRMPDLLPQKGEALAILAAYWFEQLGDPERWKEFSRSTEAHRLRKANRFGASFNEQGEEFQAQGLKTHYLGVLRTPAEARTLSASEVRGEKLPDHSVALEPALFRSLVVERVQVVKPNLTSILGSPVADYQVTRTAPAPRLIPLELVFRFSAPPGSSLRARIARDPRYLSMLGYPELEGRLESPDGWDFPILEAFTKLEPTDRIVSWSEALAISGISATTLQALLVQSTWVAGFLKWMCGQRGLELADGKLEWALSETGEPFLVDAIGPDELRLSTTGASRAALSKEFLRIHYRKTPWYEQLESVKNKTQGSASALDWKKNIALPPLLPDRERELATQLYWVLTNVLTGQRWFPRAWSLKELVERIHAQAESAS